MHRATCGVVGACVLLSGCSTHIIRIESYRLKEPVSVQRFVAGAGKKELTPPPGIPLGGHGPGGRVARGYWTRLFARAFYFQDRNDRAVALVSCDLFMVPFGLRAKVLAIVNRTHRLEDSGLILAATHTHHSPANYASAPLYNAFAGPLPNFEPKLFDFLAGRIAAAIVEAIDDARQHAGETHTLALHRGYATGLQRNRAIAPFFRNASADVQDILNSAAAGGAACPDGTTTNCPRYFAVDPSLVVLKVARNGMTRALLTFYAMHPTAMTHDSELYSGDVSGIAMTGLESGDLVAGFFNGAQGDVSPDWTFQDRDDVLRLADAFAARIRAVVASTPSSSPTEPTIEVRWARVPHSATCGDVSFASAPLAGAAELGGAEDGRTLFYNYGWRPEARRQSPRGEHGVKEPALDGPLAGLAESLDGNVAAGFIRFVKPTRFAKPDAFPQQFPVAVVRLRPLIDLVTIPVEATTAVGHAIRRNVNIEGSRPSAIVGLANEYVGYTTTRKEYELQQYEAASTLLGPAEADMVVCLLNTAQPLPSTETVGPQTFDAGPARKNHFGPETLLVRRARNMVDEDLEPLIPRWLRRMESRIPRFLWPESGQFDWDVHKRRVQVLTRPSASAEWTEFDSDRGANVLTVLRRATPALREYVALWIPPANSDQSAEYSFRVERAGGGPVCSTPFRLNAPHEAPVAPVMLVSCGVQ